MYNFLSFNNNSKKPPMLLIHGWGGSLKSLESLATYLSTQIDNPIYNLELPGFGKTQLTKSIMTTKDYAQFVSDFLHENRIEKPILIGHSFGGKIILEILKSKLCNPKKIILINISGLKPNNSIKKSISNILKSITPNNIKENKKLKQFFYNKIIREHDYLKADNLKPSLSKIVEEHYDNYIENIKLSTLIIWGEKDRYVPLWMGRKLNNMIKYSELIVVPNATHGLPLKYPKLTADLITNWINR